MKRPLEDNIEQENAKSGSQSDEELSAIEENLIVEQYLGIDFDKLTPLERISKLVRLKSEDERKIRERLPERIQCTWLDLFLRVDKFREKSIYERIDYLGAGTFSKVVSAKNKENGELVAIKNIYMNKDQPTLSLMREIMCLMHCSHVNIIKFVEVLSSLSSLNQSKISIVTELCDKDLYYLIHKRSPLGREFYKDMLHQMLLALQYIHSINIIHRDIKSSNFLITSEGVIKLADFGLAKHMQNELAPHTPVVVTLAYRAPELLLSDKNYSSAIDMWSLGCCLAEILLGEPLFDSYNSSEISHLNQILQLFGSPREGEFEFATISFKEIIPVQDWRDKFLGALKSEIQILELCFVYDSTNRLTASKALSLSFWTEKPQMQRYIPSLYPDNSSESEDESEENQFTECWFREDGTPFAGKRLNFSQTNEDDEVWDPENSFKFDSVNSLGKTQIQELINSFKKDNEKKELLFCTDDTSNSDG